jgi:hypothetical protein
MTALWYIYLSRRTRSHDVRCLPTEYSCPSLLLFNMESNLCFRTWSQEIVCTVGTGLYYVGDRW